MFRTLGENLFNKVVLNQLLLSVRYLYQLCPLGCAKARRKQVKHETGHAGVDTCHPGKARPRLVMGREVVTVGQEGQVQSTDCESCSTSPKRDVGGGPPPPYSE